MDKRKLGLVSRSRKVLGTAVDVAQTVRDASSESDSISERLQRGASMLESIALRELRRRMDQANTERLEQDAKDGSASFGESVVSGSSAPVDNPGGTAQQLFKALLERSLDESRSATRERYVLNIVQQLVPDEARILRALAAGESHALLHIRAVGRMGFGSRTIADNLSSVGKTAGVRCRDLVPIYVEKLRGLGLVETDEASPELKLEYELLESDGDIRRLLQRVEDEMKMRPKFVRRTLRLSPFGREFAIAVINEQAALPGA